MKEYLDTALVLVISMVIGWVFTVYLRPWLKSKINTDAEAKAYYKSRKLAQIAKDMVRAQIYKDGKTTLTEKMIEMLINELIEATDIDPEIAKRVITAAVTEAQADGTKPH